ncbi:MAG: MFS transporter [Clostridiales bacterium]|nr:MFS transporter [Clostridiales bacterium]
MIHLLLAVIYLAFISLGLPDALLGAAWPSMYGQFGVPLSYMGAISMIIALGTVVSSLQSDRLTRWLGAGKVTALSVATTAVALYGFSISRSFAMLCLWAIPYGLGAGSVDAALNNYVALHYASRHMSWLHCMWGVGASVGPSIMGYALMGGQGWNAGYRFIALLQLALTALLLLSLPLWRRRDTAAQADGKADGPLTLRRVIAIPGAREIMIAFLCYCSLEQTAGQWASSYLALHRGLAAETAAGLASLFYIGITVGRALSGFLTLKLNDTQMTRLGMALTALGVALLLLPLGQTGAFLGLAVTGLGCAPVYPCLIHSTPARFGAGRSQALIGVQMASAYVGTCVTPPLFGAIAGRISMALYPAALLAILLLMTVMHERLIRITERPAHKRL